MYRAVVPASSSRGAPIASAAIRSITAERLEGWLIRNEPANLAGRTDRQSSSGYPADMQLTGTDAAPENTGLDAWISPKVTTRPAPSYFASGQTRSAPGANSMNSSASTCTRCSATPSAGHETTKVNGPGGGSGHTQ